MTRVNEEQMMMSARLRNMDAARQQTFLAASVVVSASLFCSSSLVVG
jgi:hypothetical protein